MSWDDDFDADDRGERRSARSRVGWGRAIGRVALFLGAAVGVVALVVGVVVAVNLIGTARNPGGFAAPAAYGSYVALPPTTSQPDELDQGDGDDSADGGTATPDDPAGLSGSGHESLPVPAIDGDWLGMVADATGIPERALSAYTLAHVALAEEEPQCGVDWATIAAIGSIESDHGRHGDSVLGESGDVAPPIIGRALDGDGVAKIADTDGGVLDGDTTWDRAVGPMQFIPSTWAKWASDANGDDVADPHQIDDAALTTARYLCAAGSMTSPEGWRDAVYSYNHDNDYVDKVARVAQEFADLVG
ncbi:lytic transglycosylase domain-containing protein [Agromyces lapidis]|uniref:Lytic transglycosylase domain-containing protein n=1 Tax=Agromyces lapidis TaxID=279574 RepID=A0ABV5SSF7_9MICO|nr:lytic murein transglycosylase [Agromyces lapidis]